MTTATLVATANTRHGFAIGITATGSRFSVVRMDRASRYVTISNHATEADARTAANREWTADRGAA